LQEPLEGNGKAESREERGKESKKGYTSRQLRAIKSREQEDEVDGKCRKRGKRSARRPKARESDSGIPVEGYQKGGSNSRVDVKLGASFNLGVRHRHIGSRNDTGVVTC